MRSGLPPVAQAPCNELVVLQRLARHSCPAQALVRPGNSICRHTSCFCRSGIGQDPGRAAAMNTAAVSNRLEPCEVVLHTSVIVLHTQGLLDAVSGKKFCSNSIILQTPPSLQLPLSSCAEVSPTAADRMTTSTLMVRELCLGVLLDSAAEQDSTGAATHHSPSVCSLTSLYVCFAGLPPSTEWVSSIQPLARFRCLRVVSCFYKVYRNGRQSPLRLARLCTSLLPCTDAQQASRQCFVL